MEVSGFKKVWKTFLDFFISVLAGTVSLFGTVLSVFIFAGGGY